MAALRITSAFILVAGVFAFLTTTARCGGDDNAQSTTNDSASDGATQPRDGGLSSIDGGGDAGGGGGSCVNPGDTYSDWGGWQRVTAFDPCCPADVAFDIDAAVPALEWQPCASDAGPGCQQLKTGWRSDGIGMNFNQSFAAHDGSGSASLAFIGMQTDPNGEETNVYRVSDGAAVAGWRLEAYPSGCALYAVGGSSRLTITGYRKSAPNRVASGIVSDVTLHPQFFDLPSDYSGLSHPVSSESTFAFELQPAGEIARVPLGTNSFVRTSAASGLNIDAVEGDDVFAEQFYGKATGWGELFLVKNDGTITPFRAKSNTHVRTALSDGVRLYWTEAYGGASPYADQTTLEVWSAPYTNDPATLATTAAKVAQISGTGGLNAIAFGGYFVTAIASDRLWVVRASDGASQIVTSSAGTAWDSLVLVSSTEIWATLKAAPAGLSGVALVRQQLATWP